VQGQSVADLTLNLKAIYFHQIEDGSKAFEYRLQTPYWTKRLVGKTFDGIVIKLGYPSDSESHKILLRPWRGYELHTITHPHFGPDPVEVFAIRVN
jgi:hypothetical protein